ncbi:MAG: N-6 DNA methylase [Acidobacteria bacterium]|nr:N-6 DNA methylase [Acidobacteriota bacterium]
MDKETLKQILSTRYDHASWQSVLTDVFGVREILKHPRRISLPANDIAVSAVELGSFNTSDKRTVGLYQVDLTEKPRIWQNRVGLRGLLRNVYKHDVDAALVVFVQKDKWRLSLISEIRTLDPDTGKVVEKKTEPKRYTYLLGEGETVRTTVDRLDEFSRSGRDLKELIDAFSVEPLNKAFFHEYNNAFNLLLDEIKGQVAGYENARLFTQRLLNRLMFLYFIQKKGWMKFGDSEKYLHAIFNEAVRRGENFYRDRLYYVFFYGLSNHAESKEIHNQKELEEIRGRVPYLNGGLFEPEKDGSDEKGKIAISNEPFSEILELFERYNFTIDESTPFDVQVAVDPEMLGKVFEELVTGRHASGSYYTPRTVVSFMCREALKHALAECDASDAITKLVDENDGTQVQKPDAVLERLRGLKVCDPACGSGAYLLGMLQELLHVREALFAAEKVDPEAQYKWKREIIENNIYGVDIDRFATQIAALRLWLSLAIESEEPHPLPNLKYKIGCGDSLLAPLETDLQPDLHRRALIEQFRARKHEYTDADDHLKKSELDREIERLRVEIAQMFNHLPEPPSETKLTMARLGIEDWKKKIANAMNRGDKYNAEKHQKSHDSLLADIAKAEADQTVAHYDSGDIFDWSVEFAEVFEDGGFDVVLANPPYVRQEEIKPPDYKQKLLSLYAEAMTGKSDLYVAFYTRALQLLRDGGTHVFVCSNSWLDVGYGAKLQKYLLDNSHIAAIYDSAVERQFSSAAINTIISFIHKQRPDDTDQARFVSLKAPFLEALADEGKRRVLIKTRAELIESGSNETRRYEGDKWGGKYLRAPDIFVYLQDRFRNRLTRLTEFCNVAGYIHDNNTGDRFPRVRFLKSVKKTNTIAINSGSNGVIDYGVKVDGNSRLVAPILFPRTFGSRHIVVWNTDGVFGKEFYKIIPRDQNLVVSIVAQLNSTLGILQREVIGLVNLGDGAIKFSGDDVGMFLIMDGIATDAIKCTFANLAGREQLDLPDELGEPDRRELDSIIFDALGLTTGERDAVYEAVIDLVSKRLQRAQTITI